jgi:glutamine amidotransferase
MITIVDYGLGNIASVKNAFKQIGYTSQVTSSYSDIKAAKILVVPGQGACGQAMSQLHSYGLISPILEHISNNRPYLGICLGFQLLFETSEEDGGVKTLGVFKGNVKKFTLSKEKIPHMGWNRLIISKNNHHLFQNITEPDVYFVHSYCVENADKSVISTTTLYGIPFVSSVAKGAIFGTQFHPEKSGEVGLRILKNFLKSVDVFT